MVSTIITIVLALVGLAFILISVAGLSIYPDFFTRLHVQGVSDTIGALCIVLAMMVQTGFTLMSLKIFLIFVLIMLTNPLGTNMMIIAAINKKDYQSYSDARDRVDEKLNKEDKNKDKKEDGEL